NGRVARVMMNAELTKERQSKIMIPTVYRDDYMGALRKLTRQSDPDPYIRMLQRAHEFSRRVFSEEMNDMEKYLKENEAFKEHKVGKLKISSKD
ncbi:MAG TPA: cell filamentation protein Fic, partial [Bacteroidia bacterium]|nr:cell filamentation protein Fic [Bacteroidia bacterium]